MNVREVRVSMSEGSSPAERASAAAESGSLEENRAPAEGEPPEQKAFVHVFPDWCKGCGICVAFCPTGVLEMRDQKAVVASPEKCVRCYLCARRCPDFAIGIQDNNGKVNGTEAEESADSGPEGKGDPS